MSNTKYTLVTGASSGIGWELAYEFAKHQHNLIITARRIENLNNLKADIEKKYSVKVVVISADLSTSGAAEKLFAEIKKQNLTLDILVNNAGFGDHGVFVKADLRKISEMIQVNISALTELTHFVLPEFIARKSGKILNVASTAAFQPGPLMTVYYATKAFVLSFTEGLHEELLNSGVNVTALCPGPTTSGFQAVANMGSIAIFSAIRLPTSQDVAAYAYKALMQNKVIAVHGFVNRLIATCISFFPRFIVRKMVMRMQKKR